MPKFRFQKPEWYVRRLIRTPSDPNGYYHAWEDEIVRSKNAQSAARMVRKKYDTDPRWFDVTYETTQLQGPQMTVEMARRLQRRRLMAEKREQERLARERERLERERELRRKSGRQMYAYVGSSGSWRDSDDEMFELVGDNYYDMAKNFLWDGDLSSLDPKDLEIANRQLEPFRDVRDDNAFGKMLGERLGDREQFLFGLRRGGVRAKPAYISPTAFEELNNVPWRGDYDSYKWLKRNIGFEDPEGYPEDDF